MIAMAKTSDTTGSVRSDLTVPVRLGGLASLALLLILALWAQSTMISGAVIASGQAMVRGKSKTVQSLDGGVVEEILVADGDRVTSGDVLLRLDPTLLQINLDIFRNRLAEVVARKNRLEAEYQGQGEIDFSNAPEHLAGISLDQHLIGQQEIFDARQEVLEGRKEQLRERILQFGNQIEGIEGLITSKEDQLAFLETELENVKSLTEEGLAPEGQLLELQRSQASLLGSMAEHRSQLAGIHNSIRDTELEILQAEREFREEVVTELREATATSEEITLEIVTIEEKLERIEILAPVSGIVHEMQVSTEGGVVSPEKTILQVIPVSEGVEFELRADPNAIDQIFVGQTAKVLFPAFNLRTTPDLFGQVSSISPSSVTDQVTGQIFYRVQLTIPPEELAKLGDVDIIPGMPVEAFLQTGERSVLAYLTKPLTDQLKRAFRDS